MSEENKTPSRGLKGLREHWRSDLIAAFSVSLVALPLALGVAIASGAPPVSGLIAAVIGGLLTNFYRGSYVGINGPAAGLIIVSLSAIATLGSFSYVLAAYIVSGALMFLFGLMRLGKIGDFFPVAVIQGMLAAIGLIIVAKQSHVALGVNHYSASAWESLKAIPASIFELNPFVTLISAISIIILVVHPRIKNKAFHYFPSPMWVLIFSIPLVYLFDFFSSHELTIPGFNLSYEVGPDLLVTLPEGFSQFWQNGGFSQIEFSKDFLLSHLIADFSMIGSFKFWLVVLSVTLVSTIEGLLGPKAVEKLEPYKRKTNLNKDLVMAGASTMLSGVLGGLPVITVISRSSVNLNHGAKTTWSNFFHGVFLLAFILFFPNAIQNIPLASLAAILIYTGFKLASPSVVRDAYRKGIEQLVVFSATLWIILVAGLLEGVIAGLILTLAIHVYRSGLELKDFIRYVRKPQVKVLSEKGKKHVLRVKGINNFANIFRLKSELDRIPSDHDIILDLSHARLVDYTTLEILHEFADLHIQRGGSMDFIGLDVHKTSSEHPFALHFLEPTAKRLTRRQTEIKAIVTAKGLHYKPRLDWNVDGFKLFPFFSTRPIEFKNNSIVGEDPSSGAHWEIADLTFDEGALIDKQVLHTTAMRVALPHNIPAFMLEKEAIFDMILDLAQHEDIAIKTDKEFSTKFLLKGDDKNAIRAFFKPMLLEFFKRNPIFHVESTGDTLLIFRHLRVASPNEIDKLYEFSMGLIDTICLLCNPNIKKEFSQADESTIPL